jgi:hypothetical protein
MGDPAGKRHLERAGFSLKDYPGGKLSPDDVLIAATGFGNPAPATGPYITMWLSKGGRLLTLGLNQSECDKLLPFQVTMKNAEHIASFFASPGPDTPLAGIGPAEVHNRDPRDFPLVAGGAEIAGDGVLATFGKSSVTFCQLLPWQFDPARSSNLKRTFRRTSVLLSRLAANLGTTCTTPLLDRFQQPAAAADKRWLTGLYLDEPEEWDDPYRFFRW